MPFDPSGNFTRVHRWQDDRDNGIRILADRHDEEDDNFAQGFNEVFLRTGTVPMIGDLVMNGNKITMLGAGSETVPSLTWELSNNTGWWQPGPNQLAVSTQGAKRLEVNNLGVSVTGDLNIVSADTATYFGLHETDNNPILHFDVGSAIKFYRVEDRIDFIVNNVVPMTVNPTNVYVKESLIVTDASHVIQTPALGPYHIVDGGDYWRYQRAIDTFEYVIGESVRFSISPTSTVNYNWLTVAGITSTDAVILPNGNAGNPALRFQDNDSGLFSGGDGSVAISTNGVQRLGIDGSGWATFSYNLNVGGALGVAGAINVTGNMSVNAVYTNYVKSTGNIEADLDISTARDAYLRHTTYFGSTNNFYITDVGTERILNWNPNYFQRWNVSTGQFAIVQNGVNCLLMEYNGATTFNSDVTVGNTLRVNNLGVFRGTGGNAGIAAINNNIGHDFRFIAKDTGVCQITNESQGWAYLGFAHDSTWVSVYGPVNCASELNVQGPSIIQQVRAGHPDSIFGEVFTFHNKWAGQFPMCVYQSQTHDSPCIIFQHMGSAGNYNCQVFNNNGGAAAGRIQYTGGGATMAYVTTSDLRLKSNIVEAVSPGAILDAIKVKAFDWRDGSRTQYGLLAQEVYEVFPDAVFPGDDTLTEYRAATEDRDFDPGEIDIDGNVIREPSPGQGAMPEQKGGDLANPWGMELSRFVPLLIKEIQELRARVKHVEGHIHGEPE